MASLFRHLVPGAVIGALVIGGMVATAPAALAGSSAQSGKNGFVSVQAPKMTLKCRSGAPKKLTVAVTWDATAYRVTSKKLTVQMRADDVKDDGTVKTKLAKTKKVAIAKGKKGTAKVHFPVTAATAGLSATVTVNLGADQIAQAWMPIDCAAKKFRPVPPKVSITKVSCDYQLTITVDARKSKHAWGGMTFVGFDAFGPLGTTVKAGKKAAVKYQFGPVDSYYYSPLTLVLNLGTVSSEPGYPERHSSGELALSVSRPASCGPDERP